MKTVVLMWNPAISSFHKEDLSKCIQVLDSYNEEDCPNEYLNLNWSIWDHEQVKDGDRFFMVKVGEGKTGIVMAGTIQSNPYKDKDWSGKDREVYYADLFCECIVDIETAPYISTQELKEAMPEFDWTGGHSGRAIEDSMAFKLEKCGLNTSISTIMYWTLKEQVRHLLLAISLIDLKNTYPRLLKEPVRSAAITTRRYGERTVSRTIILYASFQEEPIKNTRTATTSGNTSTASALAAANCHTRRLVRNWARRISLTMNYGMFSKWGKSDYMLKTTL